MGGKQWVMAWFIVRTALSFTTLLLGGYLFKNVVYTLSLRMWLLCCFVFPFVVVLRQFLDADNLQVKSLILFGLYASLVVEYIVETDCLIIAINRSEDDSQRLLCFAREILTAELLFTLTTLASFLFQTLAEKALYTAVFVAA